MSGRHKRKLQGHGAPGSRQQAGPRRGRAQRHSEERLLRDLLDISSREELQHLLVG